jgi:hypothetical protein
LKQQSEPGEQINITLFIASSFSYPPVSGNSGTAIAQLNGNNCETETNQGYDARSSDPFMICRGRNRLASGLQGKTKIKVVVVNAERQIQKEE